MSDVCYHNGRWVDAGQPLLSTQDLGVLRGYGAFEFFYVQSGVPLYWETHLKRLEQSARTLCIPIDVSTSQLKDTIDTLIKKNKVVDGAIQILLTAGPPESSFEPTHPQLIISSRPRFSYPKHWYDPGISLQSLSYQRPLPKVKSTHYLTGIHWHLHNRDPNLHDVLYCHEGKVHETMRCNIFFIDRQSKLVTPKDGILEGVTRHRVLQFSKAMSVDVQEIDVLVDTIPSYAAAFLTSTTRGVMPVSSIDGHVFEESSKHELVMRLQQGLAKDRAEYVQHAQVPNKT